mgnify:FL=1
MNIAKTLDRPCRSLRAVRSLLRVQQREDREHLRELARTGCATPGQIAHLARRMHLRRARIAVLEREVRHAS